MNSDCGVAVGEQLLSLDLLSLLLFGIDIEWR